MQSFYTAIEHFRKCGETRYLAHGNFFFPQQDRCSACGNDVYALAFQRTSKRSNASLVRNGNESAANFHEKLRLTEVTKLKRFRAADCNFVTFPRSHQRSRRTFLATGYSTGQQPMVSQNALLK